MCPNPAFFLPSSIFSSSPYCLFFPTLPPSRASPLLDKICQLEKEKTVWSSSQLESSPADSSGAAVGKVSPLISQDSRMDLVLDLSQQVK